MRKIFIDVKTNALSQITPQNVYNPLDAGIAAILRFISNIDDRYLKAENFSSNAPANNFLRFAIFEKILQEKRIIHKSESTEKDIFLCADWAVRTIPEMPQTPIHDLAPMAAKNLSVFFGVSEQLIRSLTFIQLYNMCRSSS